MRATAFTRTIFLCAMMLVSILACKKDKKKATAEIWADEATEVTATKASIKISITTVGNYQITDKGICWGTSSNPTTDENKISQGPDAFSFTASITNLVPGKTYYARGYFINAEGNTVYSGQITFATTPLPPGGGAFTVTTNDLSEIGTTSASGGGNVSGSQTVTARGLCWSTSQDPTISSSKTSDGSGSGAFASRITGLTAGTQYYVRAYATSSAGTVYGAQLAFSTGTTGSSTAVTVTTNTVTGVSSTAASAGGSISGSATVTARGVCWGTSPNPTTSLSKTSDGSGTGSFSSAVTGLAANTLYYLRAYATTASGTTYGSQVTFTTATASAQLSVSTNAVSAISGTQGSSGGTISGTGDVTARGICWSTSQNPTVALATKTANGTGTGSFAGTMSSLTPGTTYYVRAYATAASGTIYGNQVHFTTSAGTVEVKTLAVSYTGSSADIKASVNSNLEVLAMGVCYATSTKPTIANAISNATRLGNYEFNVTANSQPCVLYYVRAFATVKGGTTYYGNELTFKNTGPLNDCHPFNGNWKNAAGTMTVSGSWTGFIFQSLTPNATPTVNWRAAFDAGLIKLGTNGGYSEYIRYVSQTGSNTWKCEVMWYKAVNSKVTEVKHAPGTINLSADGKQLTVSGDSPFGTGFSSGVLYKQ